MVLIKENGVNMEFINNSNLEFKDLSDELFREYIFPTGTVRIDNPLKLNVSSSGGHRVFDAEGFSNYIPAGWLRLRWKVKEGRTNFAF